MLVSMTYARITPMIRFTLTCALVACSIGTAFAGASTAGSSAGAGTSAAGSSASSKTTSPDDKLVLQARDDAASFVASDGRIRGAQLEAALRNLRERHAVAQRASDMQLAQAILAL
jgi:uncharacterized protein (TIGR02448 family)